MAENLNRVTEGLQRELRYAEQRGDDKKAAAISKELNKAKQRLKKAGKEVADTGAEAEPKVNDGKVGEILERVGDDADLATEALEAEQAEKKPRSSLVEALEAVIAESIAAAESEG